MLFACWSAKGGAGTTVVATALALLLARSQPTGALLVDLAGDAADVLGLPPPSSLGLADWLRAGPTVPADALGRLEAEAAPHLGLLPRGSGQLVPDRAPALATLLERSSRAVVVDCGNLARPNRDTGDATGLAVARRATRSLLVIRPCGLSLRHARQLELRPTGAVVVVARDRAIGARDVERSLGVPVVGRILDDPAVGRAVDAGLLAGRLPRSLERGLRHVVA